MLPSYIYRVSAACRGLEAYTAYIYIQEMVLVTRNDSNRDSLIFHKLCVPPHFPAVECPTTNCGSNVEALLEIHAAVILCY